VFSKYISMSFFPFLMLKLVLTVVNRSMRMMDWLYVVVVREIFNMIRMMVRQVGRVLNLKFMVIHLFHIVLVIMLVV